MSGAGYTRMNLLEDVEAMARPRPRRWTPS